MTHLEVLEKLAKWRTVFAWWQLGTRPNTDGELRAVENHREVTIFLRAEVNALTAMMIKNGMFTVEEFADQVSEEAIVLDMLYEQKFPGFSTTLDGVNMDVIRVKETMQRLGFPA